MIEIDHGSNFEISRRQATVKGRYSTLMGRKRLSTSNRFGILSDDRVHICTEHSPLTVAIFCMAKWHI